MTEAEEILAAAAEQRVYLVFAGDVYYPGGGAEDFRGSIKCSTDEQAKRMAEAMVERREMRGWWQVARLKVTDGAGLVLEVVHESGT